MDREFSAYFLSGWLRPFGLFPGYNNYRKTLLYLYTIRFWLVSSWHPHYLLLVQALPVIHVGLCSRKPGT